MTPVTIASCHSLNIVRISTTTTNFHYSFQRSYGIDE
ncbi:uncharacterized protein METZ01_LOCUS486086, partial [marine metagenome]